MKVITKKVSITVLSVIFAVLLTLGIVLASSTSIAQAEDVRTAPNATTYFYDHLTDENGQEYTLAKKFYKALEKMNEEGEFVDGVVDYNISEIATSEQIKNWIDGKDLEVPKAFSAARDAFLTDHPELFYINFYKMTISVAMSGGNYVGFINSGREANLYYENGLNTKDAVEDAIAKFNARIEEIVDEMNKLEAEDTYTARDVFLAKEVNKYLAKEIKYDYVAYENKDDPNYIAAAYINSAYGGLVEGKAVCGGFSTAYKVIMDKLGIPCITVNGYSNNKDENGNNAASNVYHMWNYVWLENPSAPDQSTAKRSAARTAKDGRWYSVDVTWNSSANNKYRYAVMNATDDGEIHIADGVISSSGYQLQYPALSSFNYGSTGETDGLHYSIVYNRNGDLKDDNGEPLQCNYISVSYNGKSASRLAEEDHLYIAFKYSAYTDNNNFADLYWTNWMSLSKFINSADGMAFPDGTIVESEHETRINGFNTNIYATQFLVFDADSDGVEGIINHPSYYSDEFVIDLNAVATGELLINQTYGTYTPAPYIVTDGHAKIQTISDSMRGSDGFIAENKAFVFEIPYDEPLHVLDTSKPIGIEFTSEHPDTKDHAKFYPVSKDKDGNPVYVELVGDNKLKFKFAPSLMYAHNMEGYHFIFTNVGSAKLVMRKNATTGELEQVVSNKVPNPAYCCFARVTGVCPARFNYDGRLYIECCAQPTLITQTDLSEDNFKDENGKSTFSENERSQMMLVAEKANTETVNAMLDGIGGIKNSNVTKNDIKASETYDINLQICKKYPTIPDGSYVKMALGFPEGYGPNDEGVTFKLYHRKHIQGDEYIIEEIPCVVTQFGIVATVTSFSPYMVAVVDADKATDKTIYASIEGKGGNLTMEDGKIQSLNESKKSYTYTIQPNDGYQIYSVKLNGKEVKEQVVDGKLTLTYENLNSDNQLVIQYIADAAAARIQQKIDSKVIDEDVVVDATKYVINIPNGNQPANDNTLVLAIVITVVCLVAVAAVAIAIVIIRKRKTAE